MQNNLEEDFKPNLTPKQIIQLGSFGGTYFRDLKATETINNIDYTDVWKELPSDWIEGLDISKSISSQKYLKKSNKYNVKCGTSLEDWNKSGWIENIDPYGWFMWYCRYYQGRRCYDDERQIKRQISFVNRWRPNLCSKIIDKIEDLNDENQINEKLYNFQISPGIRQSLQHWGYVLTKEDFMSYINNK